MARVQRLLDERIIRQVTPIFDTRALGYRSMLVAAKVDPENPHRAAKIINAHPGVSHNYLRNHEFNLWFTIATEPDSQLGLRGHARRARGARRAPSRCASCRRSSCSRSAWTSRWRATPRRSPAAARGASSRSSSSPQPYDELRHRGDPRARRATCRSSPEPYAPAAAELGISRRRAARAPRSGMQERGLLRRVAAILFHRRAGLLGQRHGRVEGARGADPRDRRRGWPPSAASRTATSARPTRTGPTRSSRWPTAAPRRSATRSSTRSPRQTGIEERATLYSSTEFKKIRLLYFTDEFKDWERSTRERASRRDTAAAPRARRGASRLTAADRRRSSLTDARPPSSTRAPSSSCPGGVNSPVRAMRSIGRDPLFIDRGEGAELFDVDGNRYVDYVCSWGPLIHGHAHPAVVEAVATRRPRGHELRRADRRRRSSSPRRSCARMPARRDGAHDLLGHRGGDERDPPRARGHRPRADAQVRRRLPRPRRRPARRGRLGPRDAGHPGQPGRHRRARRPTRSSCRGTTPRRCGAALAEHASSRRSSPSRCPANMGLVPPAPGFLELLRERADAHRRAAGLRRGDHRLPRRARRRAGARPASLPDLTIMGKVIGGGLPAAAYGGRARR